MLGSNVPTIGGFYKGFQWGDRWGCECIQIYTTLSRRWNVQNLYKNEIKNFQEAWNNSSVKEVIVHVPFLVNLASSDELLWGKSINRLITEIKRAEKLKIKFLVLHPGSYRGLNRKAGLKRLIDGLNIVLQEFDHLSTKILLETMAGQGKMLGSSFEELASILSHINKVKFLGICFDTGHVFMAGYDLRGYKGYNRIIKEFDRVISIKKIKVFHLNDSKTTLNSRNDRHACIGEGELGLQTFHSLVNDDRFINVPKILEIPERDKRSKDNLDLLKRLRNRFDPLPSEKYSPTQLNLV